MQMEKIIYYLLFIVPAFSGMLLRDQMFYGLELAEQASDEGSRYDPRHDRKTWIPSWKLNVQKSSVLYIITALLSFIL